MKDDRLSMLSVMYIEAEVLNIKSDDILVFVGVCLCLCVLFYTPFLSVQGSIGCDS